MLCQNSFFFFVKSLLYGNFAVVNQVSCLKTYAEEDPCDSVRALEPQLE